MIPLPENLKESIIRFNQMGVRNINESAVDLNELSQVCGIDTTDVENISAGTDTVENTSIKEKVDKSPSLEESM